MFGVQDFHNAPFPCQPELTSLAGIMLLSVALYPLKHNRKSAAPVSVLVLFDEFVIIFSKG